MPGDNVAYVVPHTISRDGTHTVSFRVRQPIHGRTLLRIGDVHQRKVRAVVPAEMVTITLAPRMFEGWTGGVLRIDAVPAEVMVR